MVDTATKPRKRSTRRLSRRPRPRVLTRRRALALGALGIVLVLAATLLASLQSPMTIRAIEVTGASPETDPAILQALGTEVGTTFSSVDAQQVQARIEAIDGVQQARLSWAWWNVLSVAVTEQTPVAVQAQPDSTFVVLDAQGQRIRAVAARPAGLPLVEADGPAALNAAVLVAAGLPPQLLPSVDGVVAGGARAVQLRLVSGSIVILGAPTDLPAKARLIEQLIPTGAKVINVTVPARPTVKDLPDSG